VSVGASQLIAVSKHVKTPTVYVFLTQEVERRSGDESLVNSVTDALILWALEGTDPDTGVLRSAEEVLDRIATAIPSVKSLVDHRLRARLEAMSKKEYESTGRAVNWHKPEDAFCLPYEVRQRIEGENAADEALRLRVLDSFEERIRSSPPKGLGDAGIRTATEVALRSLQLTFEHEGLEFASFLESRNEAGRTFVTDLISTALDESGEYGTRRTLVGDAVFSIVRGVLYDSREDERRYLGRLARTYALLFTLNTEPRLIEFFQEMAGDFYLYVGADQLIRALSEHYLAPPDQMTRNTLLLATRLGASVVLTEPVLDEVVHHFRVCDNEFRNHISAVEHHMTFELARNAPHIMLRAYLYMRLNENSNKKKAANWPAFVNQFVDYPNLHRQAAFDAVRRYLQVSFGLKFQSTEDLEQGVDLDQVERLADGLSTEKALRNLARNDALLAHAVYARRRREREGTRTTVFGAETWWLTNETSILRHSKDLVIGHHDVSYIMRPDFLLNFLTLAPRVSEARAAFSSIFPSLLGITLARRMNEDAFHRIIKKVEVAGELDEARRSAAIARLLDQLKSDFRRQYTITSNT
jgi:hypothetical protein